jgi:hypothetical protein
MKTLILVAFFANGYPIQLAEMRALDCARAVTQVRLGKEVRLTGLGNVKSPPIFHAMCVENSTQSQLQTAELTALIY